MKLIFHTKNTLKSLPPEHQETHAHRLLECKDKYLPSSCFCIGVQCKIIEEKHKAFNYLASSLGARLTRIHWSSSRITCSHSFRLMRRTSPKIGTNAVPDSCMAPIYFSGPCKEELPLDYARRNLSSTNL